MISSFRSSGCYLISSSLPVLSKVRTSLVEADCSEEDPDADTDISKLRTTSNEDDGADPEEELEDKNGFNTVQLLKTM